MDARDIRRISEWLVAAGLQSIEIEGPEGSVRIVVGGDPQAGPIEVHRQAGASGVRIVAAAAVGTFLDRHPWRVAPFVAAGSSVGAGDVVGLIRTGIAYLPVVAANEGRVGRLLVRDGERVEFGQPILELAP